MTRPHPLVYRICRQVIGDPESSRRRWLQPMRWAYCDLAAHAWCFDCDHYVCDIHAEARHRTHDLQTVADEIAHPSEPVW
jgi:hypothetical protein